MNVSKNPNGTGQIGIILSHKEARILKTILIAAMGEGEAYEFAYKLKTKLTQHNVPSAHQMGGSGPAFITVTASSFFRDKQS